MVLKYGFRGLMAPVFTPYTSSSSLELNLSIIPKYADYLKSKGVRAILVNGTTGEHVLMTTEERKLVAEAWAEATKKCGQTLMIQVGGTSLPDVLQLAKHAESLQASGILCLPDLFFKPKTAQDLTKYLKLVSEAAPKTPLFYYHIPGFTEVKIPMNEFLINARKEIKTISGIKFTSTDLEEGAKCLQIDPDYTIFLGADTIFSAAVTLGFDSAIATTLNFWPQDFQAILDLIKEGKAIEAKAVQTNMTERIENILKGGNWVIQMKKHMVEQIDFPVGLTRLSFVQ